MFEEEMCVIKYNKLLILFVFLIGASIGSITQANEDKYYIQDIMFDSATTNELINDGNFIYHISIINNTEIQRLYYSKVIP